MPFSFSNISVTAIFIMITVLSFAELVKYLKHYFQQSEK